MLNSTVRAVFLAQCCFAFCACEDKALTPSAVTEAPALSLLQTGARILDLHIKGSIALRGIQARLRYDTEDLRITKIEAGKDALRIDRLFHGDLSKHAGDIVIGLTDTRQVFLPVSGSLLKIYFEPRGENRITRVSIEEAIGAPSGGEPVALQPVQIEVDL